MVTGMKIIFLTFIIGSQAFAVTLKEKLGACSALMVMQILDTYYTDCSRYPTVADGGLKALMRKPQRACKYWGVDLDNAHNRPKSGAPYINELPLDPWGRAWLYTPKGEHEYFLTSLGADGKTGGVGESADIDAEIYLKQFPNGTITKEECAKAKNE